MKSCIIYYSHSGHTRRLAEQIAKETHGDLLELIPEIPYPQDYSTVVAQAKKELQQKVRPKLKTRVPDLSAYDMLFIGTPNWWNDVPMAVLTFMESYDWTGKTIIPFCTSGGGGFGQGVRSIEAAADGAVFLEGFHVNGSSVDGAATDVSAWLNTVKNQ